MSRGRGTAADQLERLLYLLPAASTGPLSLDEAAERLGVDRRTILDDLADVTARQYYHPAGSAEELRVEIDGDHVRVFSHGKFERPARLSPRESLAAHVALRRYAATLGGDERERVLDIAERIAERLATATEEELSDRFSVEESGEATGIRLALRRAVSDRQRCRITYLRSGGDGPSERTLDPYAVAVSHGTWFAVGYCGLRRGVRVFRVDRILDIEPTEERFEVPEDFDLDAYLEDGRVFRSDATERVVVRYTGWAAAWIRERGPTESDPDGGVRVTYEVADPGWVVRHVLQQGGQAEVLEPEEVRQEIARVARRMSRPTPIVD